MMNKIKTSLILVCALSLLPLLAQEETGQTNNSELQSETIERDSQQLDKDVAEFSKKIGEVVKKYDLMNAEGIQILPYRMDFKKEDDHLVMTRHTFIRRDDGEIAGLKTKTLKVYGSGDSITKLESVIAEQNYYQNMDRQVTIVDPSPTSDDTSDITFKQVINGKTVVEDKKLGEIRNTAAFPVANTIKREFYVPHLSFFYYSIRSIGETYTKSRKDTDTMLTDFLKESTEY